MAFDTLVGYYSRQGRRIKNLFLSFLLNLLGDNQIRKLTQKAASGTAQNYSLTVTLGFISPSFQHIR